MDRAPCHDLRRYLSTREAAIYCGVKPKTIRFWVAEGILPAYVLPSRGRGRPTYRFLVDDLDRVMQGQCVNLAGKVNCALFNLKSDDGEEDDDEESKRRCS